MLNHQEKYTVVESTQVGIYQHDLYSWQLMANKFKEANELTAESEFIDKTLKEWLNSISREQREKFWVTMFDILSSTNEETLSQINKNWFVNYKTILSTYKNLDEESKTIVNQTIKALFNIAKQNIKTNKKESQNER